ncbi:FACT complex subunit spt16 [Elasticomyces elasticus]|uniref:FACT complex subunit n=1 Tax=Exophiala sideris TaxID=1016849 RepID=A0ABR0JNY6_9EURO|nr:FACT complex subunit spt16 [Elasticomyces elasticus]KAK5038202.1 FACT complex subunit spt16 [Exophiala sideris]KAK5044186.1 FACT complex subunit spt16 [Exophiala sideris]KAK5067686.1 FACT complex subunit spt16 [Exophiala sideris]KAK5184073.1 FACT complex subunit spt16 [Eurotiomycetes sp. CCFEE 6388]
MGDIVINPDTFFERLSSLYNSWKADKRSGEGSFGGADSIVVLTGKADQDTIYTKNNALHFWLLGYEFPATLMVFTTAVLYIVTTEKKARHLANLKNGKIPLEILAIAAKEPESRTKAFEKCVDIIKNAGKKVGVIPKAEAHGPFVDEWVKLYGDISKEVEEVDVSGAFATAFAVKDETELRAMRTAGHAASAVISDYWVDEMSEVLDKEKKVTHSSLSEKMGRKIDDQKFFKSISKLPSDFDNQQLDWAYGPIVQSGGQYDFKLTAQPNNDNLHSGCIIAGLGFRYKTYCSIVARTYLIDPSKSQTANYKILLAAHEAAMKEIKDGVVMKDVYNKALGVVKSRKPELEKNFGKDVGAAIGIEIRDAKFVLNGKNTKTLKDGMTVSITTTLADLTNDKPQDKKGVSYSLLLTDTVRVTRGDPVNFTKEAATDLDSIEFYFKDDEEETKPKQEKTKKSGAATIVASNIKSSRLRGANRGDNAKEEEEARRREHQRELAQKKQREGLEKYAEATGDMNGENEKKFKKFESYKRDGQLPPRVKDMIVWVDLKASTVILPIMGRPVPFHINAIKNVSKSDEGEYTHLRFNFLSPGQGVGRKDDQPFEDPQAHFIRSLTVRSKDQDRLSEVSAQITELRKAATRREQEKKEMEDVVEQDKLVEIRNRRPIKLSDVYLRPAQDGKRVPGEVEIHQNGLRYLSPLRNDHVDVVFSNVKHLFFQPCVGELIVLIHVHLKNPIIIGKRKTKDVQFYREATDMAFDETGNRKRKHRYGDEEEFEQEQEERRRRAELDRMFKGFAEKISDAAREYNIAVDIPFRELSFNGVPFRSNVLMAPTTDALVQLTEPPFTVITLDEIEIAHLERIQFGLKNFDLVFVYKDYNRPPTHVNTIPVESLDRVREWLDSVDIAFTEGPLNLNWGTIMKTVTTDPHQFFKDGGWSFLNTDTDSEGDEESEEESAFEMSDSELAASESESDEESDFDDASASDDEGEEEDLSDEGEDWDEMEKKAKKEDTRGGDGEDEDKGRKRKR